MTIGAEKGSDVVVREQGAVVASGRATGGSVTLSWTTSTGAHSYAARATDKAGNTSRPAGFTAEADADPPRLSRATWTPGTREDTRTTVRFRTAAGASYQVLVDGGVVAEGTAESSAVKRWLDLGNGAHDVAVEAVDDVGNVARRSRRLDVRIPSLAVGAELVSKPTTHVQVVRVSATPNSRTGRVTMSGAAPKDFTLKGGKALVRVRLPDDTYGGMSVTVRDSQGRRGVGRVDAFEVDTTPPLLGLDTDSRAAAGGSVVATVRTEPGVEVRWTLTSADGVTAEAGTFTAKEKETTISRDVDAGTYRLEVVATDQYDRTVKRSAEASVATDPTPIWLIVLTGLGVAVGGILAVFLVPLLLKWLFGLVAPTVSTRRERRRLEAADLARREHQAEQVAVHDAWQGRASVVSDFLYGVTAGWDVGSLPGFVPHPGEIVRHMTVATVYESQGSGPADHVTTSEGALLVTGERLVLIGDGQQEWPLEDVRDLVHVSDDESVVHHTGDDERWTVLSYGEPELTRLHLDQLTAEIQGRGAEHLEARRAELAEPTSGEEPVDLSAWV
ncbi:hypothetical protein [Nocardioides marmoribigeumensis]|uniref:Bacterial Ig-like domain-containing protein n=1 Tax=Nocardioides marmoribigeumensis TaxID=433649 RepID=A0ABU2BRL8_9ACTN|nr:hypothetical protein [Nocardioides marmoribigeumensis]MDR7360911.1 hypothetical protein [Nocardioides marmoribigeumensis]